MGLDYALVHLYYTLPPAAVLTVLYGPVFTRLDAYKLVLLILVAVAATIPWDSYLIRHDVWGYPPDAVLGLTVLDIPIEELFFFVIQTYNTSFLYFICSKPTFHVIYLQGKDGDRRLGPIKWAGAALIVAAMALVESVAQVERRASYMHLILVWAGPFLFMLWLLSYQFLIQLPWTNTLVPIAVPTVYLWVVDTIALRRGTWVVHTGTKLNWQIWRGLDIEEAVFFLATNSLIVFGLVAFDNALAILDILPSLLPDGCGLPNPLQLVQALTTPVSEYDEQYVRGLDQALDRLRRKSRSFFIASGVFPRALRRDLILLYSYCRSVDDLIDEAPTPADGKETIKNLRGFLERSYDRAKPLDETSRSTYISKLFPEPIRLALELLPTDRLPSKPLYDLLQGFDMDLRFTGDVEAFPVADEQTLETYANRVASTVAELCIELVYYHDQSKTPMDLQDNIRRAGQVMGVALQYVNIARDIRVDAAMGRVYIPTNWLAERGLAPADVLENPERPELEALRQKLLDRAFAHYRTARPEIELLPFNTRGSVRVMIESYMEIGRTLRRPQYQVKDGKATVSKARRLWVAWKALNL